MLHFFGKIFERLVFAHVKTLLECHFGPNQFGFRSQSSTTYALISLHNFVTEKLDSPQVKGVQIFALDLSKAFDMLRHDLIIQRLIDCNLSWSLVTWIASYLSNRTQSVRYNNLISNTNVITSGVPQGRILGPAIFDVVFGVLNSVSNTSALFKYADDVTLAVPIFLNGDNCEYSS